MQIKNIFKTFLLITLILALKLSAFAEYKVIGKGDYNYENRTFSSSPTEDERKLAIDLAKINAIVAYSSTMNDASRALFEQKRSQFLANASRYIIRYNFLDDELNKSARMYSVIIEAYVDDVKIKGELGNTLNPKDATLAKNNIGVFFIAREVASSTSFDKKITKVAQAESSMEASQTSASQSSAMSHSESLSNTSISTTGGSATTKSDVQEYRVDEISRSEFGAALTDIFSAKGMDNMYDGGFFESITYMEEDYGVGANVKPTTWRRILKELKDPDLDMKYIVVGTVDLGGKEIHNATGQTIVPATVTAKIYDIQGVMPKLVVALRPIMLKGIGTDQSMAKKQALKTCATDAAEEIIDKLRQKGLL
ncbi:MAG: hypothetical protein R3Y46_03400 [Opitutales bacterium]